MKVSLEKEGKNVIHLDLEVEAQRAVKAYEVACRHLSSQLNVPGFRKGKVPKHIVEKTVGIDYIKKEALDNLLPQLLGEVIEEKKLDLITQPEIDTCNFELGEPLTLKAKFEVRPDVALGEYKGVSINVPEAVLPEDALDRSLNGLADSMSARKIVTDREVKLGDFAVLDFECTVDGKLIEDGKADGLTIEVKENGFLPNFCEQIVGHKPQEQFDVKANFPEDYRKKELAGKEAIFKVKLLAIQEKQAPEISDGLAKMVGQESLEKLKELLSQRLADEVKQENEGRAQKAVVDAVVAQAKVDLPETMVEREFELLMNWQKEQYERMGDDWAAFEASENFAQVKENKKEEAKQRVLTSLVLGAIVKAENLIAGEEEIAYQIVDFAQRYNVPVEKAAGNHEVRRIVLEEVLTGKVVELLTEHAKITYIPDTQDSESAAEGKKGKGSAAKKSKKEEV